MVNIALYSNAGAHMTTMMSAHLTVIREVNSRFGPWYKFSFNQ